MRRAARSLGVARGQARCARWLCMVAVVCCVTSLAAPASLAGQVRGPVRTPAEPSASPAGVRHARSPVPPEPQSLSIEDLTPSRLRPGRPVRVRGTVFNDTEDVWGDAQVGMLVSSQPLTSPGQIAARTRADPYEDFVGEQVLDIGTFDDIGDVAPGESRSFAFTVPYAELELGGQDGVYWVGAELRATDGDGLRGSVARTLTFMPLVTDVTAAPTVDLAMLWPMTAAVPWDGQEFIDDSLSAQLAEGGRLDTLAELAASADEQPLTWVLDPAVLQAAQRMADGFTRSGEQFAEDSPAAQAASAWLGLVRSALGGTVALALPYAHPDVPTLAHADIRAGLPGTRRAAERVLDELGIARLALLWPAGGHADKEVLAAGARLDSEITLLHRNSFADRPEEAVVDLPTGAPPGPVPRQQLQPSLVVDGERNREGLRAQPGQSTLQWRQLILSNTALRSLYGGEEDRAAIAMPSRGWWPDDAWFDADLFAGLQVPWINQVGATALAAQPHPSYVGRLHYPRRLRRQELREGLLELARRVRRTSRTINALLVEPDPADAVGETAFGLSTSSAWRGEPRTGLAVAAGFVASNLEMIDAVDLEAPEFVTLSSTSGRFPISITNGLDEAVTVELEVSARDPEMRVAPIAPITLQADQRVTTTVVTNAQGSGITTVTARLRTERGRAFGARAVFQVRTTQIGSVVWIVMGIGAAVLFGAAARRIIVRVRRRRRRSGGGR